MIVLSRKFGSGMCTYDRVAIGLTVAVILVASTAFALFSFYDPIQASALERAKDLVGLPAQWQFNFQHPFSQTERELYRFHNFLLGIDVAICALVTTLVVIAICLFRKSRNPVPTSTTHNTTLEVTWTILPVIVLMVIGAWSFPLLKRVDSTPKTDVVLKVTGNQWYWSYEYPDLG